MDEPIYLKFCRELKHQKIFHTCLRAFQNLDQGPDGALKTVFLKYGQKFGMAEPSELTFCRKVKHQKVSRVFPKFEPGACYGFENLLS